MSNGLRHWHSRDCGSDDRLGRHGLNSRCCYRNGVDRNWLLSNRLLSDRLWNRHGHCNGDRSRAVRNRRRSV